MHDVITSVYQQKSHPCTLTELVQERATAKFTVNPHPHPNTSILTAALHIHKHFARCTVHKGTRLHSVVPDQRPVSICSIGEACFESTWERKGACDYGSQIQSLMNGNKERLNFYVYLVKSLGLIYTHQRPDSKPTDIDLHHSCIQRLYEI